MLCLKKWSYRHSGKSAKGGEILNTRVGMNLNQHNMEITSGGEK
jgi:hypothetical protein